MQHKFQIKYCSAASLEISCVFALYTITWDQNDPYFMRTDVKCESESQHKNDMALHDTKMVLVLHVTHFCRKFQLKSNV